MQRRQFIGFLGGAVAWPITASGQQSAKPPIIGFLGSDASVLNPRIEAFVTRLRELGWIEDRTIAIEYRWSEGLPKRSALPYRRRCLPLPTR